MGVLRLQPAAPHTDIRDRTMPKIIIDTDRWTDDVLALMMTINPKELDIQGITTIFGNAALTQTTQNALCLLEYMNQAEVPIYRGDAKPLGGNDRYLYGLHRTSDLTVRLPRPKPQPIHATGYIVDLIQTYPREVMLIALRPLTNVATALGQEPQLKKSLGTDRNGRRHRGVRKHNPLRRSQHIRRSSGR